MSTRKSTRFGAVLTAALLTASACGGSNGAAPQGGSGTGTITIWASQGQPKEVAALQNIVQKFNAVQTAVKAQLKLVPEADYPKTVAAKFCVASEHLALSPTWSTGPWREPASMTIYVTPQGSSSAA